MAKMCNEGINDILSIALKGTTRPSFYIGLFTNTTEPAATATLASITEPGAGAYARIQLTDGDWAVAAQVATNLLKTFTASGGDFGNVYGWFLCTAASGTSGKLYLVQLFTAPAGPFNITDGNHIDVTPAVAGL